MRTLKLTHDEIELIQRALGIAELKFNDARKHYISKLVTVRGVNNPAEAIKEADFLLKKENEFCDLLLDIKNGDKDV